MNNRVNQASGSNGASALLFSWPKFWLAYFLFCNFFLANTLAVWFLLLSKVQTFRHWTDGWLCRIIAFCLQLQPSFKIQWRVQIPQNCRGSLFISNHRSHLDVWLYLAKIPNLRVLANPYLFQVPILGQWMRLIGQIPFDQRNIGQTYSKVEAALRSGDNVLIFPELTRCQAGAHGVGKFTVFPFQWAMDMRVPIYPLSVSSTDQVWPRGEMGLHWGAVCSCDSLPVVETEGFKEARLLRQFVQQKIEERISNATENLSAYSDL